MADDFDQDNPSDRVKKAMAGKKSVPNLTVIEGGEGKPEPKRRRRRGGDSEAPPADGPLGDDPPPHESAPEGIGDDDEFGIEGFSIEDAEKTERCAQYDQNDRDNGRRLIVWFGDDIAYVSGLGWLVFLGTHWARDEGDLAVRLKAQDLVDKIKFEAFFIRATAKQARLIEAASAIVEKKSPADYTEADKALIKKAENAATSVSKKKSARLTFAVSSGNAGKTSAMILQAASLKSVDQALLDSDRRQFNCGNGTLHFERIDDPDQDHLEEDAEGNPVQPRKVAHVEFRPHRREDMNTKLASVDYDPEATCPKFMKFIEQVQPDPVMRKFLQVFHAYAMLNGGNPEQRLIFHFGFGANGKSIFIETLGNLAGTFRTTVSPDTITGDSQRAGQQASPDIARLHNTRFVVVEELPRGTPLKENLVKAVSGGGTMTARFLQKEIFEFKPIFVAILSGNDMPEISGTDNGIWRRVLIMPWEVQIPDELQMGFDDMLDTFVPERPGILNWLIEGMKLYLRDGLKPYIPDRVREFTQAYRSERDPIGRFVEACVIREGEGYKVQAKDMFDAYVAWCEANGILPWKQTAFGRRMTALGFKKEEGRLIYYIGVRLGDVPSRFDPKSPPPPSDPGDPGWKPSQL
ncbi:DNA primase/helicase, phage-associated [Devosia sp. H5989]|nr:DNA primase/helicase, phage-associated [Devosia sp. H5989]